MIRNKSLLLAGGLALALLLWGCGSDDEQPETASTPQQQGSIEMNVNFDWELLEGQFVQFYYQPVDSIREKAPALLSKTEEMYSNITFKLQNHGIDTLYFFCFADLRDLLAATGLNYTTVRGDSIFYGYGPVYGKQLTQYVMKEIGEPRYLFMKEGLPTALDYSRRNFHDLTYERVQQDEFFGVDKLTDNVSFAELPPEQRVIEAASLCTFLLTQWGPVNFQQYSEFRHVYDSQDDFATAAETYFGATPQEIEERWLEYLPTQTDEAISQREQTEDGQ